MIDTKIQKINKQIVEYDSRRMNYVEKNSIKKFLKFYTKNFDISNANTGQFWNSVFSKNEKLSTQSPMTKDKISWIASQIENKKNSILDLGIGSAFVEELLKDRGGKHNLSGIDVSKTAIEKAKKNYKGKFVLDDVLNVKKYFRGKKFDIILAVELLEHISVSKLFSLYKQIHNLLKNDGQFILSVPINENLHLKKDNPSAHVRDYTFGIIKTELILSGFEIEKVNYLYAFEKYYYLKKMLSKIFRNRWQPNSLTVVARKVDRKDK